MKVSPNFSRISAASAAEVTLAGQAPFPAVFGHRVPLAKLASVAPGVKVAVAVDPANPYQEVAIDWDKSPIDVTG